MLCHTIHDYIPLSCYGPLPTVILINLEQINRYWFVVNSIEITKVGDYEALNKKIKRKK